MKLAVVLVSLFVVASVEGKGWWMEQPYDNDDFNVRVEYGDDINVTCDDDPRLDGLDRTDYTVQYWVIPDMTIMNAGDYLEFKTLDGQAGWEVSNDAYSIRLFIVTENHFGFYYCLININETQLMIKRAVNYKGPYFDDLWDDYRMNTIVACASSVTFLAIVGGLYAINFLYERRKAKKGGVAPIEEDEDAKRQDEMEQNGYTNDGYEMKENFGTDKEKDVVDEQPQPLATEENDTTGV